MIICYYICYLLAFTKAHFTLILEVLTVLEMVKLYMCISSDSSETQSTQVKVTYLLHMYATYIYTYIAHMNSICYTYTVYVFNVDFGLCSFYVQLRICSIQVYAISVTYISYIYVHYMQLYTVQNNQIILVKEYKYHINNVKS